MGAWGAIIKGLRKSFVVEGRATRPEFWWLWAFHFIVPVVLIFSIAPAIVEPQPDIARFVLVTGMCLYVLSTPASFCAIVRRQHDVGKSGKITAALYTGVIVVAVGTALFLMAQEDQLDPFRFVKESGLEENPLALAAAFPLLAVMGFAEVFLFIFLAITVIAIIGPPILLTLLILGIGLARPSENGSNKYGPNPHEVTS